MKIIVGHTNMDLDSIASIVLARYLYPEHVAIKSRLVSPMPRHLMNMYQYHLDLLNPKELEGEEIEHAVLEESKLTGIITRSDYLAFRKAESGKRIEAIRSSEIEIRRG